MKTTIEVRQSEIRNPVITEQHDNFGAKIFSPRLRSTALALGMLSAALGVTGCGGAVQRSSKDAEETSFIDQDPEIEKQTKKIWGEQEPRKLGTITDQVITSRGLKVNANPTEWYGHGFIIGSPINSGDVGLWFKTYELHINQGYFPDDLSYIGSDVHLSIDERDGQIFGDFKKVEKENHQQFVFEYVRKHPLNPEIEDSTLFLQNIYTLDAFRNRMNVGNLPLGVTAKFSRSGSIGTKTKVGRIVDIERNGQLGDFATLEINMSGLSSSGGEKLVSLAILDEDVAKWCEKALPLGRDVEVDVSEDFIEMWQPSRMFVNGIRFKNAIVKSGKPSVPPSGEQYEAWRDRLLKDPVFLEAVRKAKVSR